MKTHVSTILSASLIGLLCTMLAGCGGGKPAESTRLPALYNGGGSTFVPATGSLTSTVAPTAANYAGVYLAAREAPGMMIPFWVHRDGRIGGYVLDVADRASPRILPIAAQWPQHNTGATVDVLDAADQPWGHIDLDALRFRTSGGTINATLTRTQGSSLSLDLVGKPLVPAALPDHGSVRLSAILAVASGNTFASNEPAETLEIARHDPTGTFQLHGKVMVHHDTVELSVVLWPTEFAGLYSAQTTVTVVGEHGTPPVKLPGHAYVSVADKPGAPPGLILFGVDGDRQLFCLMQIGAARSAAH